MTSTVQIVRLNRLKLQWHSAFCVACFGNVEIDMICWTSAIFLTWISTYPSWHLSPLSSRVLFFFGLNFRMKHEDSMKTSLRPSILPPASRLVNWLLLMALMRPMQAVQPARDCYSSTSGHLEPKVGWYYQHLPCFFSSWTTNKKITARFIWRSDSLPVFPKKYLSGHLEIIFPDSQSEIMNWGTGSHAVGDGIGNPWNGKLCLGSLGKMKKTTEFFRFSPTSSQNHCKDTSFWGGSVLIRFF